MSAPADLGRAPDGTFYGTVTLCGACQQYVEAEVPVFSDSPNPLWRTRDETADVRCTATGSWHTPGQPLFIHHPDKDQTFRAQCACRWHVETTDPVRFQRALDAHRAAGHHPEVKVS